MIKANRSADRPKLAVLRPTVALANLSAASPSAPVLGTQRVRGWKLQQIRTRWINGGPDDDTNRQMLCDPCHDEKTKEDLRLWRSNGGK